ncbi:UNVERIFIED_CONTAM: hypothetical protein FKN15_058343, partial [Acipenser sinensis]
ISITHPALALLCDPQIDNYHGTEIPDPYAWLEDPDSEETKAFVEAQNELTMPFLEKCALRGKFTERMTELYDYPKYSCPYKRGNKYFFYHNTGLQNQSVLYIQDSLNSDPRIFFDPNKLSADGTVSLQMARLSEQCECFAYGLSGSGSDWVTVKFMTVADQKELPDTLERVKFSCLSWTHDDRGVFYNCYPRQEGKADGTETTTNLHQKLYYHVIGTDQSQDILVAEFPDNPKWQSTAEVSDDGRYVLLNISEGCEHVNRLWYCDLQLLPNGINGLLPWVKVIDNFDAKYSYITNEETVFTFLTNLDAPRSRVINIDLSDCNPTHWRTLIPEHHKDVLDFVTCVNGQFLVVDYMRDAKDVLQLFSLTSGKLLKTLPLDLGTIAGFSGRKKDTDIFYKFYSFLQPGVIYHCDLTSETLEPTVFRQVEVKGFNPTDYQTVQASQSLSLNKPETAWYFSIKNIKMSPGKVYCPSPRGAYLVKHSRVVRRVFFPSKDGTKIPMFIVHKKGIKLDGSHPVLLYGYGGFNHSQQPSYNVAYLIFVRHLGGVLAVANIRGGGEYGETWHKGGSLGNKQNCFDDFQCGAEYLIREGYTSSSKLTIRGASNGGLLVGRYIVLCAALL